MEKYNKEEIKTQVQKVIHYSQGIDNPKIDKLMDDWEKAKKKFIEYMDGNLIYESPDIVTFPLGEKEKMNKISDFCSFIEFRYLNLPLSKFIHENRETFFDNVVGEDYVLKDGTTIPKGMKLIKAFKFFESSKDVVYELQNRASQIIQEDKVSGKICISVHPLDFLSASENVHKWRSCHALDGEYRSGNLSYMVDSSTVMVYIKSEENYILPSFPASVPWNSKKWRVWLYFSEDERMMFAGRQYPFKAEKAAEYVKDTLLGLAGFHGKWSPWYDKYIDHIDMPDGDRFNTTRKYLVTGSQLRSMTMVVKRGDHALNYNDLLNSTYYTTPMYCYRRDNGWLQSFTASDTTKFVIGGPVKCVMCENDYIMVPETMRCEACEDRYGSLDLDDFVYCSICGCHFYADDGVYVGDEWVCPNCESTAVGYCDRCNEPYFNESLTYDRESGHTYCPNCLPTN